MEVIRKRQRTSDGFVGGRSKSMLSMYIELPTDDDVSLEEFERLAYDRLAVLRECEAKHLRGTQEENEKRLQALVDKHLPLKAGVSDERDKQLRADRISHFILRLAYCGSEDNRRWFLRQECDLLKHRLNQEKNRPDLFQDFLEQNGFAFPPISSDEYEELVNDLEYEYNGQPPEKRLFYKVPFEEVPELVSKRAVVLKHGFAYVLQKDLVHLVATNFRAKLSKGLAMLGQRREEWMDERLKGLLGGLTEAYTGNSYTNGGAVKGEIRVDNIDQHAGRSFPPCMFNLHMKLRENHHLKHGGRMQFGLFLKGCGLSLEDSLAFWRSEFSKVMPVDKFDKQYAYNIRHNYGREGKRTDYTPKSCLKIIMEQPGASDHHGCPFRHFEPLKLEALLKIRKVPTQGIQEALDLVKGQHYQIACSKCFEHLHPGGTSESMAINHPNEFFEQSFQYFKSKEAPAAQAAKPGTAAPAQGPS